MKSVLAFSILLVAASPTIASAYMADGRGVVVRHHHHRMVRMEQVGDGVAANGRCGGVSYGTGERRCGSATGGPPGGLPDRP